jgi:diamine N-acetyltransferase
MDIRVRLATLDDYDGFVRVAREVHDHHVAALPEIFRSVGVAVPRDYFEQLVTGEETDVLVAEADGGADREIAGYAVLVLRRLTRDMFVSRSYAYIENFGVAEAYRRHGIGRELIAACIAWARERGATSLELECWEANQGAIAFYESSGMRVTRRWFAMDI